MPILTPDVPIVPALPSYSGVESFAPVRGVQATSFANMANHLIGRGGMMVPWSGHNKTITVGSTINLYLQVWPRYQASHRLWFFHVGAGAPNANVDITDPSGGVHTIYPGTNPGTYSFVETVSARASTVTAITLTVTNNSGSTATLYSYACQEIPRPSLTVDSTDQGVDIATQDAGAPIYDDTGISMGGVYDGVLASLSVAKRSHAHFARDASQTVSTTSAAYTAALSAPLIVLDRYLYSGETQVAIPIYVKTRSGAGTTGNVRFTAASGATLVVAVTAADGGTWRNGTLNVDVEDLSASDGRRSSRWETVLVEFQRTAGANSVGFDSISVGPRSV